MIGEEGILEDLIVNGSRATAQVVKNEGITGPIAFRKTGDGWRVDFPEAMFWPLQGLGNFQIATTRAPIGVESEPVYRSEELTFYDRVDRKQQNPCKVFKIRMMQGRSYIIELQTEEFNAHLRLEDLDGTELAAESDGPVLRINYNAPGSGDNYIVVSTADLTGKFALKIHRDFAQELDQWVNTKFGNWSLWQQDDTGVVLVDNTSKQVIHLLWSSGGHVKYCDAEGTTQKLDANGGAIKEVGPLPNVEEYRNRKPPERELAMGVYQMGDWKVRVNDFAVAFQPADLGDKGLLMVRKSSDEFFYSGRNYRGPRKPKVYKTLSWSPTGLAGHGGALESKDIPDPTTKKPCKIYNIPLTKGKNYDIRLRSDQFNPYLRLEDSEGNELAADSVSVREARISHYAVQSAVYQIVIATRDVPGVYYLWVESKETPRIPNNKAGAQEYYRNGAKFGIWSLWVCPVQRNKKSAYLLYNQKSKETIYLSWTSKGWINHRTAEGTWNYIIESTKKVHNNPSGEKYYDNLKDKQPTKMLTKNDYKLGGNWEFTVSDEQIEFRTANREGILVIRPYTEEFTFNGQSFPMKKE